MAFRTRTRAFGALSDPRRDGAARPPRRAGGSLRARDLVAQLDIARIVTALKGLIVRILTAGKKIAPAVLRCCAASR
jgi:hypothetical protein